MQGHWFWWLLTVACVVWYCVVTVYVAIRGVTDIRTMLRRLSSKDSPQEGGGPRAGAASQPSREAGC